MLLVSNTGSLQYNRVVMSALHASDNLVYSHTSPWHFGHKVEGAMSSTEVFERLGDYTVEKRPVFLEDGRKVLGKYATVRTDTGDALGIVGKRYEVVQNRDAFRFIDEVAQDPNGAHFTAAGYAGNGAKVWMTMDAGILDVKGDEVRSQLMLMNRHDGTGSLSVFWTDLRLVCNNMLTYAGREAKFGVKLRHSAGIHTKVADVQDALGIIRQRTLTMEEVFNAMADREPTKEEVDNVLNNLFPDVTTASDRSRAKAKSTRNKVRHLAAYGQGNDRSGVRGTVWALYNGVTEYADHHMTVRAGDRDNEEAKFESRVEGSAAALKATAYKECKAMLG